MTSPHLVLVQRHGFDGLRLSTHFLPNEGDIFNGGNVTKGIIASIQCLIEGVHKAYKWKIPRNVPCQYQPTGNYVDDNLSLRDACNQCWRAEPAKRVSLAEWYVRDWGGVKGNKGGKIASYVELFGDDRTPKQLLGVPSWSKVGSLSNPDKYLIFDTRVAFSLNSIIIRDGLNEPFFFMSMGRNTKLNPALAVLKRAGVRNSNPSTPSDDYHRYLELLANFGAKNKLAEMALFAAAEKIASDITT